MARKPGSPTPPRGADTLSATTLTSHPTVSREPVLPEDATAPPWHSTSDWVCDPMRYQIMGEHGRGGLGLVSRAHDRRLRRDIAIKELISRGGVSEVRFLREALITARLEHPGIVPVHEAGRWPDGTPFYAMKLVAGRPLRELIAERPTVAQRIGLLHHVIAVADALAYAHRRNIIHRDLKPSNVIVGEFGETIVIDWGLAKEVTAPEHSAGTAPSPVDGDRGLTATGSILGTPAYMAPEQQRGEPVDQRADVFAIGAMLWELCALEKVPPAEPTRRRILRRAGIDQDLATIIEKALHPDADLRYPDAGALAADLKAFKSGARIAARSYSPLAMLAHWTRRHRALALSVAAALAVAVSATVLYVRNIAVERDRADAALVQAESAKTAAVKAGIATEAALADQMLKHAELLVATDPSAALDVLAHYRGADQVQRKLLEAEAVGRGVARMHANPHTSAVLWARGFPDQSVATLGVDGAVAITSAAGAVTVLARDGANKATFAYAATRRILAYVCRGEHICLVDFSGPVPAISAPIGGLDPDGLAFSPSEARLAAVGHDGTVKIWEISDLQRPVEQLRARGTGWNAAFLDEQTLAVGDVTKISVVSGPHAPAQIAVSLTTLDVSQDRHAMAFGTGDGTGLLVDAAARRIGEVKLCVGSVGTVQFVPGTPQIAYGCKNGIVGLWDLAKSTVAPIASLQGAVDYLAVSSDRRELAAGGSSGIVSVIDLQGGIVTSYLGHNLRISGLAAPDAAYPFFVSSDVNAASGSGPGRARWRGSRSPRRCRCSTCSCSATPPPPWCPPPARGCASRRRLACARPSTSPPRRFSRGRPTEPTSRPMASVARSSCGTAAWPGGPS